MCCGVGGAWNSCLGGVSWIGFGAGFSGVVDGVLSLGVNDGLSLGVGNGFSLGVNNGDGRPDV